jgi:uncharacterized protein (TIGR00369 family)
MDERVAQQAFESALQSYEQAFGRFFLARFFELEVSYAEDICRVEMPVNDYKLNPQGTLHGGVTAFMMDISMGHLLNRHVGPGATLEMNIQYLKAARAGKVAAVGSFIRKGRQICFLRSELTHEDGSLIASATSTWKVFDSGSAPGRPAAS